MKNPYPIPNNQNNILTGLDLMGDNIRKKLKFCGDNVVIHPLCKMIRSENAELDDYSHILDNVFIDAGKSLKLGKYSILTWFVLIEGGAKTFIGDRVFVGPGSKILTSTYKIHGFYAAEFLPEEFHETEYGDITIEDDAYISANCTIMPGVTIHEGAVAGANSLINKDLEPWGIYVGTPCKKIGERQKPSEEMKKKLLEELCWENHL
jgi:acetyltransferase-like isoleucine patch superfamily enzyme